MNGRHVPYAVAATLWVGLALTAAACKSGSSSAPSGPAVTGLTGAWSGTAADSSGPGLMTWQITQSGDAVSGTFTMIDSATTLNGRGSVNGTVSGSTLRFILRVAAGGFDAPHAACTLEVNGEARVSDTEINGTYSGSNSCAGTIATGQLTLNKR
jgi:hypothetical protein